MYARFMLVGDRLVQRWGVDPTVSSVPEKPRLKALPPPAPEKRR